MSSVSKNKFSIRDNKDWNNEEYFDNSYSNFSKADDRAWNNDNYFGKEEITYNTDMGNGLAANGFLTPAAAKAATGYTINDITPTQANTMAEGNTGANGGMMSYLNNNKEGFATLGSITNGLVGLAQAGQTWKMNKKNMKLTDQSIANNKTVMGNRSALIKSFNPNYKG